MSVRNGFVVDFLAHLADIHLVDLGCSVWLGSGLLPIEEPGVPIDSAIGAPIRDVQMLLFHFRLIDDISSVSNLSSTSHLRPASAPRSESFFREITVPRGITSSSRMFIRVVPDPSRYLVRSRSANLESSAHGS